MADKKISALPAATTPLAGTEVLPIVQGGTTDKVAVSELVKAAGQMSAGTGTPAASTVLTLQESASLSAALRMANRNSTQAWALAVDAAAVDDKLLAVIDSSGGQVAATVAPTTGNVTLSLGNLKLGTAGKGIDFSANANAPGMTSELLTWYEEGTWTPSQGAGLTVVGAFSSSGRYTRIGRLVQVSGKVSGATSVTATAGNILCGNLPFASNSAQGSAGSMMNADVNASGVIFTSLSNIYAVDAMAATPDIVFSVVYFV